MSQWLWLSLAETPPAWCSGDPGTAREAKSLCPEVLQLWPLVVPVCWAGSSWPWLYSLAASPSEQGSSPSELKDELLAEWDDSEGGQLLPGDSERSCSFTSRLSITFSFWSSWLSLWR